MSAKPATHTPPSSASLSTPAALWRLKPFVRPIVWRLVGGAGSALAAAVLALMVPIVLEQVVRGLDTDIGVVNLGLIVGGAVVVLLLGFGEAAMVWLRRWFVLTPATEVEFRMRSEIYARLQTLPVAFHDRWQSGQLLSRMMQDIGLIRRWIAFGLILLVVNVLTIIIGSVLLFQWHWMLGVIFLVTGIAMWIQGYLFE